MPLTIKEIKEILKQYKTEHSPALSKMRRHELINFAMKYNLLKEGDLSKKDLEIHLGRVPAPEKKRTFQEPKEEEPQKEETMKEKIIRKDKEERKERRIKICKAHNINIKNLYGDIEYWKKMPSKDKQIAYEGILTLKECEREHNIKNEFPSVTSLPKHVQKGFVMFCKKYNIDLLKYMGVPAPVV